MDIEKVATSSIENLISRNSYLKPIIDNNDKTPVWDGDVFVYRTKDRNKSNNDLIGRVPVQVKGYEVERIDNINLKNIKFRVDKEDMQKYLTDGGVIYFVVYVDKNTEKIFYNSLLPLDLARLMKKYSQQKTFEIELKSLPVEERKLADIFLDFVQNRKKQQGTLIPEILHIDDIEKIQDEIREFKFSYSTVEPKESILFKELTTRDFYIYAEPKGIGNPIPFERVSNAIVNIQHKLVISIKGQVYYHDAYVQWEKGLSRIVCGKSLKISLNNISENKIANFNVKAEFKGSLNEQLNDLYFIRALVLNKEFSINEHSIPYDNFNFEHKEDLYRRISDLEHIKYRLEHYGVKSDLDLDAITEEEEFKLSLLMEEEPLIKKYNINLSESNLLKLEIANITIILTVKEDSNKGIYKIYDFFKDEWKVTYVSPDGSNHIPVSQFLILNKDGLLADNINTQKIIKDIQKYHGDGKNLDCVNNFLLEAIKAYDKKAAQQIELKSLIEKLSNWLYEQSKENYIFLNLAQVKYRLNQLNEIDKEKIINISLSNQDDIDIMAATSILLDKKENAEFLIEKMNPEQRDLFMSYPIYYLLENNKVDYVNTKKD